MCLQGANTGAVLVPFMFPEIGIVTPEIFPVLTHIIEQISAARIDQDQRDIAVFPFGVAVLIESAVAVIGPVAD